MNKRLQAILNLFQQSESLTPAEKKALADAVKESDKEITITEFKLERTEKVKRTTSILLEETIAELEEKRKSLETQKRELEIEAALEKVRSRSLAMHKSDELFEVANTLYIQLRALNLDFHVAVIHLRMDKSRDLYFWVGTGDGVYPSIVRWPYVDIPVFHEFSKSWGSEEMLNMSFGKADKDKFMSEYYKAVDVPEARKKIIEASNEMELTCAFDSISAVQLFKYKNVPFAEDDQQIVRRFSKVFGQAYTRFLDLQKAEAQAYEVQIQLALERVRAKTMAMHKSEELADTAQVLFQQLIELGGIPDRISIGIVDETNALVNFWSTDQSGSRINNTFKGRLSERTVIAKEYKAWKEKKLPSLTIDLRGEELNEWIKFARDEMGIVVNAESFKNRRVHNTVFFSHGWILVSTHEDLTPETKQILERFALVFNLTYRRFLDLQQAEAQAKEAQIEAALERVRSRTLAMHKSEELAETSAVLIKQLNLLGIEPLSVYIGIVKGKSGDMEIWSTDENGKEINKSYLANIYSNGSIKKIYDAWSAKEKSIALNMEGEELQQWLAYWREELQLYFKPGQSFQRRVQNVAFFSQGFIAFTSTEVQPGPTIQLLERFAAVFNLTYTRFLDLQKAEEQAREAQIETALEKVRSRSLAMHKSDEVAFVVDELFLRMKELEIVFDSVNILEFTDDAFQIWAAYQPGKFTVTKIPFSKSDIPYVRSAVDAKSRGEQLFSHQYLFEEKNLFLNYLFDETHFKNLPDERKQFLLQCPCYTVSIAFAKNTAIQLQTYTRAAFSESENNLLRRFANVFEQAYTRFLDLKKAEEQGREATIEAALERVRSRTMAMQRSDELADVAQILFKQVEILGIHAWSTGFNIWQEGNDAYIDWVTNPTGGFMEPYSVDLTSHSFFRDVSDAKKRGEDFQVFEISGETLKEAYALLVSFAPKQFEEILTSGIQFPSRMINHYVFGAQVSLMFVTPEPCPQAHDIFKRFGNVFEQTYTRFLDLQKAEAQSREAQIEVALERIRAKALAMQSSKDLIEVTHVLREQMGKLGQPELETSAIHLYDDSADTFDAWYAYRPPNLSSGALISDVTSVSKHSSEWAREVVANHNSSKTEYTVVASGQKIQEWYKVLEEVAPSVVEYDDKGHILIPEILYYHFSKFSGGALLMISNREPSLEARELQRRAAVVFDLAYTRFLDLKKAEAQAREAQIEASLERVRSKTMAMHNSHDVGDTVATLFDELTKLGVRTNRCGILIFSNSNDTEVWTAKSNPSGEVNLIIGHLDVAMHPMLSGARNSWKNKNASFSYEFSGDDLMKYYQAINNHPEYPIRFDMDTLPSKEFHSDFYFPEGAVFAFTSEPITADDVQIFKRLAGVFGQTYRRYLDLQKAEAQAREATIEASLERVRAKAMAMHSTADLTATVSTIFIELRNLGIKPLRFGLGIIDRETRIAPLYSATVSDDGSGSVQLVGSVLLENHPVLEQIYESWINKSEYFPVLKGELLKSYYQKLRSGLQIPEWHADYEQYGQFYPFEEGTLYAWTEKPSDPSETPIFRRFTSVLALTYRRYNELQLSEANACEAIRRASIDRVRAEIASMRTTTDLERITPLIWNELTELGVPFIRCGVFIMDEAQEIIHTFLSTPDGQAIGAFHLPYTTPGRIQLALSSWKKNERYIDRWTEEVFREFANTLVKQGALPSPDQYLSTIPHGGFYLHFLPFLQGMLYVGNMEQLKEDQLELIQTVADAFSTAYARYEDFNKLEAAKQHVDKTLLDLKKTQNQLVISEKMASLGELTAGIAHEIQNPLNFVNNFSEVSTELLNEMNEEIEKGNFAEVKTITDDIRKNLEKILHHGKRADGIVKGMLLHSRSSSGIKEPTDINALTEEYLRLAYHGLRAKDKSFNVKTNTNFDESIGIVKVVPQDIGRVVLNLITNAFYAVSEKKNHSTAQYEPTVSLTTKKYDNSVSISVKDNGNGIPQNVLDKIFQPFFTTKPAGQGTGLGLSLSYDIVKAHGGELKVDTTVGVGSEFTVSIMM